MSTPPWPPSLAVRDPARVTRRRHICAEEPIAVRRFRCSPIGPPPSESISARRRGFERPWAQGSAQPRGHAMCDVPATTWSTALTVGVATIII